MQKGNAFLSTILSCTIIGLGFFTVITIGFPSGDTIHPAIRAVAQTLRSSNYPILTIKGNGAVGLSSNELEVRSALQLAARHSDTISLLHSGAQVNPNGACAGLYYSPPAAGCKPRSLFASQVASSDSAGTGCELPEQCLDLIQSKKNDCSREFYGICVRLTLNDAESRSDNLLFAHVGWVQASRTQ